MTAFWLPLFVALPVLAAALAALCPWTGPRRVLALGTPALLTVGGLALLPATTGGRVLVQQVGDFAPGVAIPLVADSFTAVVLPATAAVATLSAWYCDVAGQHRARFFAALSLLLLAGAAGVLLTGDLFNLFVFVEVMLMPSYALLAIAGGWRRLAAGRLFVVVNLLTSSVLLAGAGLVYGVAGTVNLAALTGGPHDGALVAAVGVMVLALCVKAGLVPVHSWLPQAYPATSPGVMALFAGLHTKVALCAVLRIWTQVLGWETRWSWLLLAVALVTTSWGALASAAPGTARGVLAWQMISGVGVIVAALGVGLAGDGPGSLRLGIVGALAYLVHHMVTMGSLITATGAVERTFGTGRLDRLSGLWRRERAAAVVVAFGVAALLGLPLTSGLPAKLEVVRAALSAPTLPGVTTTVVVLASSFVGLVAMLRLWRAVFWGPPMQRYRPVCRETAHAEWRELPDDVHVPRRLLAPAAVSAALSVALFVGYGAVAPLLDRAADALLDPGAYRGAVLGEGASGDGAVPAPVGSGDDGAVGTRPMTGGPR